MRDFVSSTKVAPLSNSGGIGPAQASSTLKLTDSWDLYCGVYRDYTQQHAGDDAASLQHCAAGLAIDG
ncbi:MAG: hypothetical protein ACI8W7_004403 [Gammaproteobacteria bacterium]|jgi:hypothetical protein